MYLYVSGIDKQNVVPLSKSLDLPLK